MNISAVGSSCNYQRLLRCENLFINSTAVKVSMVTLCLFLIGAGITCYFLHVNTIATYTVFGAAGLGTILTIAAILLPSCRNSRNQSTLHVDGKKKTPLTISSPLEENQFQIFSDFKLLIEKTEESPSDEHLEEFRKLHQQLMESLGEEVAISNITRLNRGSFLLESALSSFDKKKGFEKELVLLHELIEALALKWDYGFDFNEKVDPWDCFQKAHQLAIRAENLLLLYKSKELGIPLTYSVLNYLRPVDEIMIRGIFWEIKQKTDLNQERINCLTKNQESIPTCEEIQNYLTFIITSRCYEKALPDECIYQIVYSRYFFSKLYSQFPSNETNNYIIVFLLSLVVHDKSYCLFSMQQVLDGLTKTVSKLVENKKKHWIFDMRFSINPKEITKILNEEFYPELRKISTILKTNVRASKTGK